MANTLLTVQLLPTTLTAPYVESDFAGNKDNSLYWDQVTNTAYIPLRDFGDTPAAVAALPISDTTLQGHLTNGTATQLWVTDLSDPLTIPTINNTDSTYVFKQTKQTDYGEPQTLEIGLTKFNTGTSVYDTLSTTLPSNYYNYGPARRLQLVTITGDILAPFDDAELPGSFIDIIYHDVNNGKYYFPDVVEGGLVAINDTTDLSEQTAIYTLDYSGELFEADVVGITVQVGTTVINNTGGQDITVGPFDVNEGGFDATQEETGEALAIPVPAGTVFADVDINVNLNIVPVSPLTAPLTEAMFTGNRDESIYWDTANNKAYVSTMDFGKGRTNGMMELVITDTDFISALNVGTSTDIWRTRSQIDFVPVINQSSSFIIQQSRSIGTSATIHKFDAVDNRINKTELITATEVLVVTPIYGSYPNDNDATRELRLVTKGTDIIANAVLGDLTSDFRKEIYHIPSTNKVYIPIWNTVSGKYEEVASVITDNGNSLSDIIVAGTYNGIWATVERPERLKHCRVHGAIVIYTDDIANGRGTIYQYDETTNKFAHVDIFEYANRDFVEAQPPSFLPFDGRSFVILEGGVSDTPRMSEFVGQNGDLVYLAKPNKAMYIAPNNSSTYGGRVRFSGLSVVGSLITDLKEGAIHTIYSTGQDPSSIVNNPNTRGTIVFSPNQNIEDATVNEYNFYDVDDGGFIGLDVGQLPTKDIHQARETDPTSGSSLAELGFEHTNRFTYAPSHPQATVYYHTAATTLYFQASTSYNALKSLFVKAVITAGNGFQPRIAASSFDRCFYTNDDVSTLPNTDRSLAVVQKVDGTNVLDIELYQFFGNGWEFVQKLTPTIVEETITVPSFESFVATKSNIYELPLVDYSYTITINDEIRNLPGNHERTAYWNTTTNELTVSLYDHPTGTTLGVARIPVTSNVVKEILNTRQYNRIVFQNEPFSDRSKNPYELSDLIIEMLESSTSTVSIRKTSAASTQPVALESNITFTPIYYKNAPSFGPVIQLSVTDTDLGLTELATSLDLDGEPTRTLYWNSSIATIFVPLIAANNRVQSVVPIKIIDITFRDDLDNGTVSSIWATNNASDLTPFPTVDKTYVIHMDTAQIDSDIFKNLLGIFRYTSGSSNFLSIDTNIIVRDAIDLDAREVYTPSANKLVPTLLTGPLTDTSFFNDNVNNDPSKSLYYADLGGGTFRIYLPKLNRHGGFNEMVSFDTSDLNAAAFLGNSDVHVSRSSEVKLLNSSITTVFRITSEDTVDTSYFNGSLLTTVQDSYTTTPLPGRMLLHGAQSRRMGLRVSAVTPSGVASNFEFAKDVDHYMVFNTTSNTLHLPLYGETDRLRAIGTIPISDAGLISIFTNNTAPYIIITSLTDDIPLYAPITNDALLINVNPITKAVSIKKFDFGFFSYLPVESDIPSSNIFEYRPFQPSFVSSFKLTRPTINSLAAGTIAFTPAVNDNVDIDFVSHTGTEIRSVVNADKIDDMIASEVIKENTIVVVGTIAQRDDLVAATTRSLMIMVLDASPDPTVDSGRAMYLYSIENDETTLIFTEEDLDDDLLFSGVVNGPTSTSVELDSMVANAHTHTNKPVLDGISEVDNRLTYNENQMGRVNLGTPGW